MREKAKKHFRIPLNRASKIALNFTGGYRSGVQIDRAKGLRFDFRDRHSHERMLYYPKTYKNGATQRVCRNSNTIKRIGKF
ncbi:hypothetical protein VN0847_04140 [Helicobacter pylori]